MIQHGTHTAGLGVYIVMWSLDSQLRGLEGILRMLDVLFYGTQVTKKVTIPIRDYSAENGLGKTTNLHFMIILGATVHKEGIKKEWSKSW